MVSQSCGTCIMVCNTNYVSHGSCIAHGHMPRWASLDRHMTRLPNVMFNHATGRAHPIGTSHEPRWRRESRSARYPATLSQQDDPRDAGCGWHVPCVLSLMLSQFECSLPFQALRAAACCDANTKQLAKWKLKHATDSQSSHAFPSMGCPVMVRTVLGFHAKLII
jgi:hypothetical protein